MLKELENWHNGLDLSNTTEDILKSKGRWVQIEIDTKFGATCWEVLLGNVQIDSKPDWHKPEEIKCNGACVIASEVPFVFSTNQFPENIVFAEESAKNGWPGLEKTIKVALDKAYELGL